MENVTVKVVNMTPDMAAELLKKNTSNRTISRPNVRRIKAAIMSGEWHLNNDAIIISNDGTLINGQHRLTAIAECYKSVPIMVMQGAAEETFMYCDRGKCRGAKDALSVLGIENYSNIAGIIKKEYVMNKRRAGSYAVFATKTKNGGGTGIILEPHNVVEIYRSNARIYDALGQISERLYKQSSHILSKSELGGIAAYLINSCNYDCDFVFSFFKQLCGDEDISNNSIKVLQKTLRDAQVGARRLTNQEKLQYIVKTWNYYANGFEAKRLQLLEKDFTEFFHFNNKLL